MEGTAMALHLHQRQHLGVGGTLTVDKNAPGMGTVIVRRVRVGDA